FPQRLERKRAAGEAAFGSFLGRKVKLAVEVSAAPPSAPAVREAAGSIASAERAAREARSASVRDEARAHPAINEAARLLGAEIEGTDEL
ncbi:MAG TPA: DNA polymerase III subunit gamma/tau, partial [Anaeromyxobacteraceae bacterium]|nr:DNA polymerase III subunit gamma/tau [Anaeromyxobacteraceae bacterium]